MSFLTPQPSDPLAMRDRVVTAASALTVEEGWARVTMARVAERVGVSRQTVYNEVGSKPELAQAMIRAELERFLGWVSGAFDQHPGDVVAGVEEAVRSVLDHARDNPLLHAVVSATHGADTELLPLLTTHSSSLLEVAKSVLRERVGPAADTPGDPRQQRRLDTAVDMVVRTVLSHVMAPGASSDRTASDVAWAVGRLLAPTSGS